MFSSNIASSNYHNDEILFMNGKPDMEKLVFTGMCRDSSWPSNNKYCHDSAVHYWWLFPIAGDNWWRLV